MGEDLRQLDADDAVLADTTERLAKWARCGPVALGVTWDEQLGKLSTDQLLDLKLAIDRALGLRT